MQRSPRFRRHGIDTDAQVERKVLRFLGELDR
jgi:hypothetical protein